MNIALMLLTEMDEFGITLLKLIDNNKSRLKEGPHNADLKNYLEGKVDAYEVAYEDYVRRLKKVNSYRRTT